MKPLLMKRILLSGVMLAAFGAASAYAKCTLTSFDGGNLNAISNCDSDNQANDGDDLKMFVDKFVETVTSINGSLNANDQTFANVHVSGGGANFETDGSGFANLKATAGEHLTDFTFTLPSPFTPAIPKQPGVVYAGWDGDLFRGQIDDNGHYNGDLTVLITFQDSTTTSHTFTGIHASKDFGVLGFDEPVDVVGKLIKQVDIVVGDGTTSCTAGHTGVCGQWDQIKQLEFSVPGSIATIPEASTWVMLITGFTLLGGVGFAKRRNRLSDAI